MSINWALLLHLQMIVNNQITQELDVMISKLIYNGTMQKNGY